MKSEKERRGERRTHPVPCTYLLQSGAVHALQPRSLPVQRPEPACHMDTHELPAM